MYFRVDKRPLRVVGLKVHKYVGQDVDGHNCHFNYFPVEAEKYILTVSPHGSNEYIEIELSDENGECGSGWCTASWGEMEVRHVDHIKPFTHTPKDKNLYLKDTYLCYGEDRKYDLVTSLDAKEGLIASTDEDAEINNEVFYWSYCGGDYYYPGGYVKVNLELFNKLPRAMDKRPVYIVYGKSGMGKSSIFNELGNNSLYSFYETDSDETLPEVITQDIIILGNKYNFSIDDVKAHLFGEPEVHLIKFE